MIEPSDVYVQFKAPEGWAGVADRGTQIAIDGRITEPLAREGMARDMIRHELCQHFSQDLRVVDGVLLRAWRSGPQSGQPKPPVAVQSMLECRLVEIRTRRGPRAVFTPAGLAALRRLLPERRAMDPARFAHLRRELGLDDQKDSADESG